MSDERVSGVVTLFGEIYDALDDQADYPHKEVVAATLAAAVYAGSSSNSTGGNRGGSGATRSSPRGPVDTVTGPLEEKSKKPCGDGTQYKIKVNGRYYSAFDAQVFGGNAFQVGDLVKVSYTKSANGKYNNIVSVEPADASNQDGPDIPF